MLSLNHSGPSLMANGEARTRGYDQVLWLLNGMVTEAGASNFFVVWKTRQGKRQLVTAPLGDKIILDGVTRRSILQLVRTRLSESKNDLDALEVVERQFTMEDLVDAVNEDRIIEAFAAGTAVSFPIRMFWINILIDICSTLSAGFPSLATTAKIYRSPKHMETWASMPP